MACANFKAGVALHSTDGINIEAWENTKNPLKKKNLYVKVKQRCLFHWLHCSTSVVSRPSARVRRESPRNPGRTDLRDRAELPAIVVMAV